MMRDEGSVMKNNLIEELEAVAEVAQTAGSLLLDHFGRVRSVERKGAIELVTDIDRRSEEQLVASLAKLFPDDSLQAEEGSEREGKSGRCWHIDPLDGTTNYVHGYSHFAVSLGCCDAEGPLLGVVFAPYLDELYTAARGLGARLIQPRAGLDQRLPTRSSVTFETALLATGFSYTRDDRIDRICELIRQCLRAGCHGMRRAGSAAIDLAHVGAGRLDGYFEMSLRPWDVAAGIVICRETGCSVTDWHGRDVPLPWEAIVASAPDLDRDLLDLLRGSRQEPQH
jgi:myo-inositol-1(or 4)-monophosphatase